MEKGNMGQLVMCAIGGLIVGSLLHQTTAIGKIPAFVIGLLLGMMVDIYLSFFRKK